MTPSEKQIEISILQLLNQRGFYCYRNHDQAKKIGDSYRKDVWAPRGQPDLEVMTKSGIVFLEVKTAKGKQSEDQIKFQEKCEGYNIPYFVVRSARQALAAVQASVDA